jgi:hypothetical protein
MIYTASLIWFGSEKSGEPIFADVIVYVFLVSMRWLRALIADHALTDSYSAHDRGSGVVMRSKTKPAEKWRAVAAHRSTRNSPQLEAINRQPREWLGK